MNVEIIPATVEDAEALVTIQQQAFKRLYDIYHDEDSPYLRGTDEIIGSADVFKEVKSVV